MTLFQHRVSKPTFGLGLSIVPNREPLDWAELCLVQLSYDLTRTQCQMKNTQQAIKNFSVQLVLSHSTRKLLLETFFSIGVKKGPAETINCPLIATKHFRNFSKMWEKLRTTKTFFEFVYELVTGKEQSHRRSCKTGKLFCFFYSIKTLMFHLEPSNLFFAQIQPSYWTAIQMVILLENIVRYWLKTLTSTKG